MDFVIAHLPGYMPSIEEFLAKGFTVEQNGHLMLRREVTTGAQLREMIIIILTALKNLNPNISVTAEAVDRNENKKILMLKDMKVVDVMQGYMGWEPLEIDDCTPEKLEEGSDRIQAAGSYKF
jgi:hypothetical protein